MAELALVSRSSIQAFNFSLDFFSPKSKINTKKRSKTTHYSMYSYLERIVPKLFKSEADTSLTPPPALPSSAACYLSCFSGPFLSFFPCPFYALKMNSSIPVLETVLHQFCHVKYLLFNFFFPIFLYYLGHIPLCTNAYRNHDCPCLQLLPCSSLFSKYLS